MAPLPGPREPGARDRYVAIQQVTRSDGASGMPVETWTTLVSEWMAKEDASGVERVLGGQVSARVDTTWEMPYRADMDPDLVDVAKDRRLVYQGRTYNILGGQQVGLKAGIALTTLAKTG